MSNSLKKDIERAQQILGTLPFLETKDDDDLQAVIGRYYDLIDDADKALSEAWLLIGMPGFREWLLKHGHD